MPLKLWYQGEETNSSRHSDSRNTVTLLSHRAVTSKLTHTQPFTLVYVTDDSKYLFLF